jgi:hypothetical protein
MKLTTDLHLVARLRITGAVLPPPICHHGVDRATLAITFFNIILTEEVFFSNSRVC